jgi:hypothetical protein
MSSRTERLRDPDLRFSGALATEGVTCVTCHARKRTILTANPRVRKRAPHALSYSPMLGSADFCAGCHEVRIRRGYVLHVVEHGAGHEYGIHQVGRHWIPERDGRSRAARLPSGMTKPAPGAALVL